MIEWLTLLIGIILALIALFLIIFMYAPLPWGAPFQPSSKKETLNVIKLANAKKGDKIAELVSGNGTLVIALAKKGAIVDGYEINSFLVWWSRKKIKALGLQKIAKIYKKNFWDVDLSEYNKIALFQIYYVMPKLQKKFEKELKKGSLVISNTWKFRTKKFLKNQGKVYLYKF